MLASAALVGVVAAIVVWCSAGAAQAAVTTFTMAPSSGPPGTVVHVSGAGCAPGLLASSGTDFVTVIAPTLGIAFRASVASNGSWQGSFTVPSRSGSDALVTALCVSSSVQSLLTIYTPQQFSVTTPTAPPVTTVPGQTPTTAPHGPKGGSSGPVGGTTPGTTSKSPDGSGVPTPTLGPGLTAILPGAGIEGVAPRETSGLSPDATSPGGPRDIAVPSKEHARAVRAATLQPADLGAALSSDRVGDSGGLGWLGRLLLLALAIATAGVAAWLWHSRRNDAVPPDPVGELA